MRLTAYVSFIKVQSDCIVQCWMHRCIYRRKNKPYIVALSTSPRHSFPSHHAFLKRLTLQSHDLVQGCWSEFDIVQVSRENHALPFNSREKSLLWMNSDIHSSVLLRLYYPELPDKKRQSLPDCHVVSFYVQNSYIYMTWMEHSPCHSNVLHLFSKHTKDALRLLY